MPSWNDSSIIVALLYFAIGGTLIGVMLLALEYYRQRRIASYLNLSSGMVLSAAAAIGTLLGAPIEFLLSSGLLGGLSLLAFGAGSDFWHAVGRAIARPAGLGTLLLVASILVGAYLPTVATQPTEDLPLLFTASAEYRVVPDVMAVTDRGLVLPVFNYENAEKLSEVERQYLATGTFDQKIIRIAEPSAECNCHGWVYTGGRYAIQGRYIDGLLADNGYVEVAEPRPQDLVIYRGVDDAVEHTGLVRHLGPDGMILVESKWGPLGVYLHPLDSQPYGVKHNFYRSPREGHIVAIVPQTSLPEADGPVLARTQGPTLPSGDSVILPEQQPAPREVYERPILRVPGQRRT
jgi:hypothetical protein